jgi:outer membrane protein
VATQDSLAILERSAERQRQLLTLGEELVNIDEVAAVDLNQVRARIAQTAGFVSQARQSVIQARLGLARVMGLEVDSLEQAPFAADPLPAANPAALATLQASALATMAEANRSDLGSARTLQESAKVLADAAKADLKRTFDLSFEVGYSGFYEGGSITRPVDLVDGLDRAMFGMLLPSARVMLTVEWPFANDVALGRLEQAQAMAQQSSIQARDLQRVIDDNTQQVVGALRTAGDEVARRQAAVEFYRQALENEVERYKLGQSTTIDVILTEEKQTSALLNLVSAQQAYASLLAQLRYELGVLLQGRIEEGRVVIEGVDPLGLELGGRRG